MKNFIPILIKLLADPNFKIALISLKIIEQIIKINSIKLEVIVPQIVEKLSDGKIALRQNVSKLIRAEYLSKGDPIWMDNLLDQLKKTSNCSIKEEILNIISKLYEEKSLRYPLESIVESVCPMMDDLKTKIKIRTLDLLVLITLKTQKVDLIKAILMSKINQVYYQMYLQKMSKQMKAMKKEGSYRESAEDASRQSKRQGKESKRQSKQTASYSHSVNSSLHQQEDRSQRRILGFPSLKQSKNSPNNTTSTSLQKYSKTIQATNPASSFIDNSRELPSVMDLRKLDGGFSTKNLHNQSKQGNEDYLDYDNIHTNPNLMNRTPSQSLRRKPVLKTYRKKMQKTLESKLTLNYPTDEHFPPFQDPQRQLKSIANNICSDDWQMASDSLTKLRRIIHNHSELLAPPLLRSVVPQVMKHAESLRSSLSKNAVITIGELVGVVKKGLDIEVQLIFSKLIKKTLDANSFISQEVKKSLVALCSNCSQGKVVTLLHNSHTSRAIPIKTVIVHILETITFLPNMYSRQIQRIVGILVDFMGEGSLEIREKTKDILNKILQIQEANSKIVRLIPHQYLTKLKIKAKMDEDGENDKEEKDQKLLKEQKQVQAQDSLNPRKKRKPKILAFPVEFDELDTLMASAESADFKQRLSSINSLVSLIQSYPQQIVQHRFSSRIIDLLSKQINDPNIKVSINALQGFKLVVRIVPSMIENNLSVVMNQLFVCFGAGRADIRQLSFELHEEIAKSVEKWMVLQHLCNGAIYASARSRAAILSHLTQLIPQCWQSKPASIQRSVYPMINKLLEESTSTNSSLGSALMQSVGKVVQACYTQSGEQMFSIVRMKARQLL